MNINTRNIEQTIRDIGNTVIFKYRLIKKELLGIISKSGLDLVKHWVIHWVIHWVSSETVFSIWNKRKSE